MLKTKFNFLYASTSLDTKTLTIASNRNFESCLSICCLAPQYIFRFFHLCRGFSPLSLATLLIVKSSSSTLYRAIEIKKKRVCEWLLFAGNHDPSSLAPGGSVVPLVCGFRRWGNLLVWRELFANIQGIMTNESVSGNFDIWNCWLMPCE